jgi:hypothetical protein
MADDFFILKISHDPALPQSLAAHLGISEGDRVFVSKVFDDCLILSRVDVTSGIEEMLHEVLPGKLSDAG